jgi:hypothetical protein
VKTKSLDSDREICSLKEYLGKLIEERSEWRAIRLFRSQTGESIPIDRFTAEPNVQLTDRGKNRLFFVFFPFQRMCRRWTWKRRHRMRSRKAMETLKNVRGKNRMDRKFEKDRNSVRFGHLLEDRSMHRGVEQHDISHVLPPILSVEDTLVSASCRDRGVE